MSAKKDLINHLFKRLKGLGLEKDFVMKRLSLDIFAKADSKILRPRLIQFSTMYLEPQVEYLNGLLSLYLGMNYCHLIFR